MDISKLLARDKAKKEERVSVLPVVKIVTSRQLPVASIVNTKPPATSNQQPATNVKDVLLKELWAKDSKLRVERAKLSSRIFRMMDDVNATQEDRKNLYAQIEGFRPELQSNYDLIEYIEKNGHLPPQPIAQPVQLSLNVMELKLRKKALSEQRCKLKNKLLPNAKTPKNGDRVAFWQEQLAMADAEYNDIDEKIKRLNGSLGADSK